MFAMRNFTDTSKLSIENLCYTNLFLEIFVSIKINASVWTNKSIEIYIAPGRTSIKLSFSANLKRFSLPLALAKNKYLSAGRRVNPIFCYELKHFRTE